jgi:hypothetical protein
MDTTVKEDVSLIVMQTSRDDWGITYEVNVVTGTDSRDQAWKSRVYFGHTDATVSGGSAFTQTARLQQQIADEIWAATVGVNVQWALGDLRWRGRTP